jgi:hypothetical protein
VVLHRRPLQQLDHRSMAICQEPSFNDRKMIVCRHIAEGDRPTIQATSEKHGVLRPPESALDLGLPKCNATLKVHAVGPECDVEIGVVGCIEVLVIGEVRDLAR